MSFPAVQVNQRVITIPISPQKHAADVATAIAIYNLGTITLSTTNLANATVPVYIYYLFGNMQQSAAAASALIQFQLQFQNAAHAAVGAAISVYIGHGVSSGATNILSNVPPFLPAFPYAQLQAIPATAVEIALQGNCVAVAGVPALRMTAGWGIDVTNGGMTGHIGGGGMVAQSATNPNQF